MTPLYSLFVNACPVTNWTDLQIACHCTETAIQSFALANAQASLSLERTYLNATNEAIPQVGFTRRTLIACNVAGGSWDMAICHVHYNQFKFEEVETEKG